MYGSDDPEVCHGKPHPDIFTVAASRLYYNLKSRCSSLLHPVALLIAYCDYDHVHKQYSELTIKMNIIKKGNQLSPFQLSRLNQLQVQASPRLRRQLPRDRGQPGRRGGWSARRHAGHLFLMCLRRGNPSCQVVMVVDGGAEHPGATAVLPTLEDFAPEEWGLPPWPLSEEMKSPD